MKGWLVNKKRLILLLKISLIFICSNVGLAQPDLRVEGIFFEEKSESFAIVNSRIIKVGDIIEGATVVDITGDFVKFQYGNESLCKKVDEKLSKQKNNISNLSLYKSRIREIEKLSREQKEEYEALQEKQTLRRQSEDMEKSERYSEYAEKADEYYDAAKRYALSKNCEEEAEAKRNFLNFAEQLLVMPMNDADRMDMDSIVQFRKKELEHIMMKCKTSKFFRRID